jgi:hypothetical protein
MEEQFKNESGPLLGESFENYLERLAQEEITIPIEPYPQWGQGMSAILNALARSATFSPLEKGARETVANQAISSQDGYSITFSGERLDEGDRDLYLALTNFYTGVMPGESCSIPTKTLLTSIRSYGKPNRDWLYRSLRRLSNINVQIQFNTRRFSGFYGGGIINVLAISEVGNSERGIIRFSIPPEFVRIFLMDYTKIPMQQRLLLKGPGSQLAKWLHSYIYSHKTIFPVKVETLKNFSGSQTKELRDFRVKLKQALELLRENKDITTWTIDAETDLVQIVR